MINKSLFFFALLNLFTIGLIKGQTGTDPYADGYKRSHPAKAIDSIYVKPDELYERLPGGDYRKARYEDVLVGRGYLDYNDKGKWFDKRRITILCRAKTYKTGDTIRIIHVFEEGQSGRYVYIMGPKDIPGEYINDSLVSAPVEEGDTPWIPGVYDGAVVKGPDIDYNFDSSKYVFSKPGTYHIQWRMSQLVSNELLITVE